MQFCREESKARIGLALWLLGSAHRGWLASGPFGPGGIVARMKALRWGRLGFETLTSDHPIP